MKTKKLIFIMNGKGGVGKSFYTTNLVQYLKDHKTPHIAIDTDDENSTLKRFHSDAAFIDLSDHKDLDRIFAELETNNLVIVDCRAASTDIFLDYFEEIRVFDILKELKTELTIISPINHEADSLEQLKIISEALGKQCDYIIVKNESHSTQFRLYENSRIRQKILSEYSGKECSIPRLYDWLVTGLNEYNLTASQATRASEFSLLDRQRLKNWIKLFEEQIERILEAIVPATTKTVKKDK